MPPFHLRLTPQAQADLKALEDGGKATATKLKKVRKTLGQLETNLRSSGLNTHEYTSLSTPGNKVFVAYVENNSPAAYRLFWHYGPEKDMITVTAITQHP